MNTTFNNRFGSFFARVQTERRALRAVNLEYSAIKLHGLTDAAINSWASSVMHSGENARRNVSEVVNILRRLSSHIGCLADQSREVFSNDVPRSDITSDLLAKLESVCNLEISEQ